MIKIKEVIVVEGRYDKNKIKQIFDTPVIETGGFSIFSDKEKMELIRNMAKKRGILVLTDSDGAGFAIRNYLKGSIAKENIKHAYIPDILGKEKRKTKASCEGKLGVEGIDDRLIIEAVKRAGVFPLEEDAGEGERITKAELYELGLFGRDDSADKRRILFRKLSLPERLSAGAFLEIAPCILSKSDLFSMVKEITE